MSLATKTSDKLISMMKDLELPDEVIVAVRSELRHRLDSHSLRTYKDISATSKLHNHATAISVSDTNTSSKLEIHAYVSHKVDDYKYTISCNYNTNGSIVANTTYEAYLTLVSIVISIYGINIILVTPSKYLCSVFGDYVHRWDHSSNTRQSSYQSLIRSLLATGASNITYVYSDVKYMRK